MESYTTFASGFFHLLIFDIYSYHDMSQKSILFLLLNSILLRGYIVLFIYSSVDEYLGCFQFLVIMNNAVMNIHICVFVDISFHSLGFVPRKGIFDSNDKFIFKFLRNMPIVFQRSCTSFPSAMSDEYSLFISSSSSLF